MSDKLEKENSSDVESMRSEADEKALSDYENVPSNTYHSDDENDRGEENERDEKNEQGEENQQGGENPQDGDASSNIDESSGENALIGDEIIYENNNDQESDDNDDNALYSEIIIKPKREAEEDGICLNGSEKGVDIPDVGLQTYSSDVAHDGVTDDEIRSLKNQNQVSTQATSSDYAYGKRSEPMTSSQSSSGKFVLRSAHKADALHVIRAMTSSVIGNPEKDELFTILRGKDEIDNDLENASQSRSNRQSVITSALVNKFERSSLSDASPFENGENAVNFEGKEQQDDLSKLLQRSAQSESVTNKTHQMSIASKGANIQHDCKDSRIKVDIPAIQSNSVQTRETVMNGKRQPATPTSNTPSPVSPISPKYSTFSTKSSIDETTNAANYSGGSAPAWKASVEERKKSKSYVVAHKPEQPIRLTETPEWKKQLQAKNKTKRNNSLDVSSDEPRQSPSTDNRPEWKKEMEQIKRQMSQNTDTEGQELPEWVRLHEQKKKTSVSAEPST